MREYRGSKEETMVIVTVWLSLGDEYIEGVLQLWCDGVIFRNQMSRYRGLYIMVGGKIS